jgi:hypothetical protein
VSDQPGEGDADRPEPKDPLSALFEQLFGGLAGGGPPGSPGMPALPGLPSDPQSMQAMFAQVQQLLTSGGEGPVNWDLARQSARAVAAEGGDPSVSDADGERSPKPRPTRGSRECASFRPAACSRMEPRG